MNVTNPLEHTTHEVEVKIVSGWGAAGGGGPWNILPWTLRSASHLLPPAAACCSLLLSVKRCSSHTDTLHRALQNPDPYCEADKKAHFQW